MNKLFVKKDIIYSLFKYLAGEKEDSNDNNHDRKDYNNNRGGGGGVDGNLS